MWLCGCTSFYITMATTSFFSSVLIWERAGKIAWDLIGTPVSSWEGKGSLWLWYVICPFHTTCYKRGPWKTSAFFLLVFVIHWPPTFLHWLKSVGTGMTLTGTKVKFPARAAIVSPFPLHIPHLCNVPLPKQTYPNSPFWQLGPDSTGTLNTYHHLSH